MVVVVMVVLPRRLIVVVPLMLMPDPFVFLLFTYLHQANSL